MMWFAENAHWIWWAIGGALLSIELIAPTAFFLSIGVASTLVAIIQWLIGRNFDLTVSLLMFTAFSAFTLLLWWKFMHKRSWQSQDRSVHLNIRGQELIGMNIVLKEPLLKEVGYVSMNLKGVLWRLEGPAASKGTQMKIVAIKGNTLIAEL